MNTHLFIQTILDEGVSQPTPPYSLSKDGVVIEIFIGIGGRGRIEIITSDEDIDTYTCKNYLRQLGLADLIPRLFS